MSRLNLKRLFSLIAICLVFVSAFAGFSTKEAFAIDNFQTDRFDVNIVANEDNSFDVEETITVYFPSPKHGIFRYVPYKPGKVAIKDIEVPGDQYSISTETSGSGTKNKLIKIGDPDKTITGSKTYTIKYTLVGLNDKESAYDLLTLDLLPKEWATPIGSSTITLTMPKTVDWDKVDFYSGAENLRDYNESFSVNGYGNKLVIEGNYVGHQKGLTAYGELPEGYWESFGNRDYVAYPMMILLVSVPIGLFVMWLMFGRDDKVVEVVEFYPPDGMDPTELSFLAKGSSYTKDLIALIPYFAEKGYLNIDVYAEDQFRLIKLVNDISPSESRICKHFFNNILFPNGSSVFDSGNISEDVGESIMEGMTILADDGKSRNKVYKWSSVFASGIARIILAVIPALCIFLADFSVYKTPSLLYIAICLPLLLVQTAFSYSVMAGKANKKSSRIGGILISGALVLVISIICAIYISKVLGLYPGVIFVVSTAISTVLMSIMVSRTEKNIKIYGRILGFKSFIETAELDRINALVEENPKYFYNILPYAYVLGLSDKWISKFESINVPAPSWYGGAYSGGYFNAYMFSQAMRNMESSYTSAYADAIGKSMDTGGGGGSFSGGGFGGGGGGSW